MVVLCNEQSSHLIQALDRLQSILDYQVAETDFISDILPRKVSQISEGIDLIRALENDYVEDKGGASKTYAIKDNEITVMIDFSNQEDAISLLSRVKGLGVKKLLIHFVLVTLVKLGVACMLDSDIDSDNDFCFFYRQLMSWMLVEFARMD